MKIVNLGSKSQAPIVKFDTVKDVPLESEVFRSILPRQMQTGTMRGTQGVGTGPKIDSSNNRITLTNTDGSSVGIGTIPGSTTNEFGFFATDSDGNLIMKIINGTRYIYDVNTDKNVMQDGKVAPDNAASFYGYAVAPEGENVEDADEFN